MHLTCLLRTCTMTENGMETKQLCHLLLTIESYFELFAELMQSKRDQFFMSCRTQLPHVMLEKLGQRNLTKRKVMCSLENFSTCPLEYAPVIWFYDKCYLSLGALVNFYIWKMFPSLIEPYHFKGTFFLYVHSLHDSKVKGSFQVKIDLVK